jgi:hypothetical protein
MTLNMKVALATMGVLLSATGVVGWRVWNESGEPQTVVEDSSAAPDDAAESTPPDDVAANDNDDESAPADPFARFRDNALDVEAETLADDPAFDERPADDAAAETDQPVSDRYADRVAPLAEDASSEVIDEEAEAYDAAYDEADAAANEHDVAEEGVPTLAQAPDNVPSYRRAAAASDAAFDATAEAAESELADEYAADARADAAEYYGAVDDAAEAIDDAQDYGAVDDALDEPDALPAGVVADHSALRDEQAEGPLVPVVVSDDAVEPAAFLDEGEWDATALDAPEAETAVDAEAPGWEVRGSTEGAAAGDAAGTRAYIVADGESLFDIARYELGSALRWVEIYELNRDLLGDDIQHLAPGTELLLPDRGSPVPAQDPTSAIENFRLFISMLR